MLRDLKHRYVDGLILVSLHLTEAHTEEYAGGGPVIVIGLPTKDTPVDRSAPTAEGRRRSRRHLRGRAAADRVRQRAPSTRPGPSRASAISTAALMRRCT